jgi:threonine dehydratase
MNIPSLSEIKRAHQRIKPYTIETPIMTSESINKIAGCNVFFKCENFQKVGAFKMRGAANMIFGFRPEERENGFATHSSGNHAQAVAKAAKLAKTKAYIVMPHNAPEVKKKAVGFYGAEIIFCDPTEEARERTAQEVIKRTGAIFVPPFNDARIIAGQATAAKEFIEAQELDVIMTPVGGGGLAAGTCLTVTYLDPKIEVILAEPEEVRDAYDSFKSGVLQKVKSTNTIADGLKVSLGDLNFEIIKNQAEDIILVSEKEIVEAMRMIWERMKIIIEPSCAVPFAALLKNKDRFAGRKVGIILTGGNVDLEKLPF